MEISAYLRNCHTVRAFPTHYKLSLLPGDLLTMFRHLRNVSENEGIEHGFKLSLDSRYRLLPGTWIRGSEGTVGLKTSEWRNEATYIGDCHSHPYRLKLGVDAEIGPSSGDYREWWTHPPLHFRMAAHFVVSVDRLFLVLSRIPTLSRVPEPKVLEGYALIKYTRAIEKLGVLIAGDYPGFSRTDKLQAQKSAWDKYAPNAAKEFAKENLDYNLDLARALRFEYFAGRLGSGSGGCDLKLLSSRLYGTTCDRLSQFVCD